MVLVRTCGLAALALLSYGMFILAGIFLSRVATTGDVLLQSAFCRPINYTKAYEGTTYEINAFIDALDSWGDENVRLAYAYGQSCYPKIDLYGSAMQFSEAPASDCNYWVKPTLNWTTSYPGVCPFKPNICRASPASDIVQFDTGYLNTLDDVRLNAPPEDHVAFRRITTCAPVKTEGFTRGFTEYPSLGHVAIYDYGNNTAQPALTPQSRFSNYTFVYDYSSYLSKDRPYTMK